MLWFCEIRREMKWERKREREKEENKKNKNIWLNKPGSKG